MKLLRTRVMISLLSLVIVLIACSDKNRVPGKYLQPAKMQAVLWDMMLADRFANQYISKDTAVVIEEEMFRMYAEIFALHNITEEDFRASMKYYISRPDQLKQIYDALHNERIRIREAIAEEERLKHERELKKTDSLMKLDDSTLVKPVKKLSDTLIEALLPGEEAAPEF